MRIGRSQAIRLIKATLGCLLPALKITLPNDDAPMEAASLQVDAATARKCGCCCSSRNYHSCQDLLALLLVSVLQAHDLSGLRALREEDGS